MSEVILDGIEVSRDSNAGYKDLILSSFIGNNGTYELNRVDGSEFTKKYSQSIDSISWRSTAILADNGYDILAFRQRPWIKNIILDRDARITEDNLSDPKGFELILDNIKIDDLYYIIASVDDKSVAIWKDTEDYSNSIPSVYNISNKSIFYGSNLLDYFDTVSEKLLDLGIFVEMIKSDKWRFYSNLDTKFHIKYGYDIPSDDRTSLRLFQNDSKTLLDLLDGLSESSEILNSLPGQLITIESDYIEIYIPNYKINPVKISIDESDYVVLPIDSEINKDTIICIKNTYSYPDKSVDYSNKIPYNLSSDGFSELNPINIDDTYVVATPLETGVITIISDNYIKLFGSDKLIYNPDPSRLITNRNLKIGDSINVGDIIFIINPDIKLYDKLNSLTMAAYIEFFNDKFNAGDYLLIHDGSRNNLIYFDNSDEGNSSNLELPISNYKSVYYINIKNKEHIDIIDELLSILKNMAFSVKYDLVSNIIYIKSIVPVQIKNISNCAKINYWDIGMYDVECSYYDKDKILSIYSKYPTSTETISVNISRNFINFSNTVGYDISINRYLGDNLLETESFIMDLSESGEYSYRKLNSNIIEIEVHDNTKLIKPGTYTLNRGITRDVDLDMMLSNIDNLVINSNDYTLFMDSGISDPKYRDLLWNKLKSHENLLLFTVDEEYIASGRFMYDYNNYINSVFSYPLIMLGNYSYPLYISWLLEGLSNVYTGDVFITRLLGETPDKYKSYLMNIEFDGYRYILSHNYIKTYVGNKSNLFPESILVLSRIRLAIYNQIDYQSGKDSIMNQFNMLSMYIKSISEGILYDIKLDSVEIQDRTCIMNVLIYLNNFRVNPINLLIRINLK